jgi:hypothetical protein
MSTSDKYLALSQYVLPVLFDNTIEAHRISLRIFNSDGIVSFICGKRRFLDIFDISCKTLRLPDTNEERLITEELIKIADKYSDMLPVLIPCSKKAKDIADRFSDELETRYIIADPSVFGSSSPIEYLARSL